MQFKHFLCIISHMAIIGGLTIPDELIALFRKLVRVNDQYRYGSVARIGHLLSKEKMLNVSSRSLLPQVRDLWASLSDAEKLLWKTAGNTINYNMWNLFVQDTSYRLKYGIPGLAVPSTLHQYKVGRLEISAPADSARLAQYHPEHYYKSVKVTGTKGLYEDVKITERLQLPLEVGLSYRAEFTATSGAPIARFYAIVTSSYQGRDIETEVGFDFDLSSDWQRQTVTITEALGVARSYDLYLEFTDVRGWIEWDNVLSRHSGTNFARDFRCNDVNNALDRVNYQIEKSWEEELLPAGSAFDSVYPT
jgi:hypothetical protein